MKQNGRFKRNLKLILIFVGVSSFISYQKDLLSNIKIKQE